MLVGYSIVRKTDRVFNKADDVVYEIRWTLDKPIASLSTCYLGLCL